MEESAFFRTMDSLQFGIGEGDIQEMIKVYRKTPTSNMIDILRLRDDLN